MNFEKMLGSMLGSFMGTKPTTGSTNKNKTADTGIMAQLKRGLASPQGMMAAAGVAFGAFEAYKKSQGGAQAGAPSASAAPPPVPGMPPAPSASATPPPVPGMPPAPSASAAPPPVPSTPVQKQGGSDSVRLIQAMIGAAYADGHMDETERSNIVSKVEESGISDEERQWLNNEMDNPRSIEELVAGIGDHKMKTMLYGLSYAAIVEDSDEEITYLNNLAGALGLTAEETKSLKESF